MSYPSHCPKCHQYMKHATDCDGWSCAKCGCYAARANRKTTHRGTTGRRTGKRRNSTREVCLPCYVQGQVESRRPKKTLREPGLYRRNIDG